MTRRIPALGRLRLPALAFVVSACGGDPRPATPAAVTPAPTRAAVEVVTEAAAVAAARAEAAAALPTSLEESLARFDEESWRDDDLVRRFRGQPAVVAPRLAAVATDRARPLGARARAVALLLTLDPPRGQTLLTALAGEGDPARAHLVSRVDGLRRYHRTLPPALLALIDRGLGAADPSDQAVAVRACQELGRSSAVPRLRAILRGRTGPRGAAALALAHLAPSAEVAERAVPLLADPDQANEAVLALMRMTDDPDPAVAQAAVRALVARGEAASATKDERTIALDAAARRGGAEALPLLRSAASTNDDVQATAVGGLIRLGEPGSLDRALKWYGNPETHRWGYTALEIGTRGMKDPAVVERLVALVGPKDPLPFGYARLVLAVGGERAAAAVQALGPRLSPSERREVAFRTGGLTAAAGLTRLHELGLLRALPPPEIEASVRRDGWLSDVSEAAVLSAVLRSAGAVLTFDSETDELPVPHDLVVHDLAALSAGAFAPEAVLQRWKDRKDEEDWDADYALQFVHAGRLYRFTAANRGDWYDLPVVLEAANRALEDAGRKERFLALTTDDQMASVLFADPVQAKRAAALGLLPPLDDPDRARRGGQAVEEKVREEYLGSPR